MNPTCIALIPARAGSKRVPGKNIRQLAGHPLIAYTISAAKKSEVFTDVVVSTESEEVAAVARKYGANVVARPAEMAGDTSPDIDWVVHALKALPKNDAFALLRPTSPFRTAATIRRAWKEFLGCENIHSMRAVEPCRQHPGKMWMIENNRLRPLLDDRGANPPWHSTPYQALPKVYAQNASLEIAWTKVPLDMGSIAGKVIAPFLTDGLEGFDVNDEADWHEAERNADRLKL